MLDRFKAEPQHSVYLRHRYGHSGTDNGAILGESRKMQNKSYCAFCGRSPPAIKMSKEHVIRSALRKYYPVEQAYSQTLRQKVKMDTGEVSSRVLQIPGRGFDMTVNKVCKVCNESWLNSKVEIPAEPLLAAAMQGKPLSIDSSSAKTIALWAAKTAAVRALMDSGLRAIPDEHYLHIMTELEPPPGTFVWLGHGAWNGETMSRHVRAETELCTLHVTTINYGHLCLFVVGISEPFLADVVLAPTIARLDSYETIRLWPGPRSASWPSRALPHDVVQQLSGFVIPPGAVPVPGEHASFDNELATRAFFINADNQSH